MRIANPMRFGLGALMLGLGLTAAAAALAEEAKGDGEGGFNGYLSLGGAVVPDYQGSEDYTPAPFWAGKLGYDEYYVELRGAKLRANVMPAVLPFGFEFGPALAYRFGRDDVANDRVDDLRDVDSTLAVGAFAKLYTGDLFQPGDELAFGVESLTGVGKDRDGTTIEFGPSYGFSPWERVRLGFKLSATYASDRYNETYFGIDADNARRSGFSTYDAEGGIKDIGFSVNANYQWTEHWGITGMIGVTRLVGDAADSPIVDDAGSATQGMAALGISYRF
ncbi:MipA/OmpV family protein [Dongia sedimenti]|uniref:MipA/OmpV family protein n=1 Tax=Dongia sedimenti TaxID=3064282 RepID=A0ABU0YVF2_9PROT|nr:MipA/OmpV family protein [Rhodospirillaceae bacterium R-7]